jgi:hypothetical protein
MSCPSLFKRFPNHGLVFSSLANALCSVRARERKSMKKELALTLGFIFQLDL